MVFEIILESVLFFGIFRIPKDSVQFHSADMYCSVGTRQHPLRLSLHKGHHAGALPCLGEELKR